MLLPPGLKDEEGPRKERPAFLSQIERTASCVPTGGVSGKTGWALEGNEGSENEGFACKGFVEEDEVEEVLVGSEFFNGSKKELEKEKRLQDPSPGQ